MKVSKICVILKILNGLLFSPCEEQALLRLVLNKGACGNDIYVHEVESTFTFYFKMCKHNFLNENLL